MYVAGPAALLGSWFNSEKSRISRSFMRPVANPSARGRTVRVSSGTRSIHGGTIGIDRIAQRPDSLTDAVANHHRCPSVSRALYSRCPYGMSRGSLSIRAPRSRALAL